MGREFAGRRWRDTPPRWPVAAGFVLCTLAATWAAAAPADSPDPSIAALKRLTLEELLNVEVSSVSRTEEALRSAAAAVSIVTNEAITRSGATTIPEILRTVPGLHVARQTANTWAMGARGFSSVNSEKLLVLSDTRSIYTPLFSGVFWDVQDYLLEDIERIEVIRGPGAALWGSNAVNGIINITTKSARDTQGPFLQATVGTEDRAIVGARYGGTSANGIAWRVFAKHADRDESEHGNPETDDEWRFTHVGFRSDWDAGERDTFTVQGDLYRGEIGRLQPSVQVIGRPGPPPPLETDVSGGNLLTRWRRALDGTSDLQLRFYYDRTRRDDPSFKDVLDTVDLDFQHRFEAGHRHQIVWGVAFRFMSNENTGKGVFALSPADSDDRLISGFVQDQIALGETLHLTLGTKLEDNDFSGFEVQPSVRLAWQVLPDHMVWAAVSRAVRVPTRLERDIAIDVTDPAVDPVVRLLGNEQFDAERLIAYEAGYRWQPRANLFFDLAAFHNDYADLASLEPGTPFTDPSDGRLVVPIVNENLTDGQASGAELLIEFEPMPLWRLSASYSYLDLDLDPRGQDLNGGRFAAGATPRNQLGLQSSLDLSNRLRVDAWFRYLDAIRSVPETQGGAGAPGSYAELDLRLAWQLNPTLELSLVGQNLLHDHHAEFGSPVSRGEIERAVSARLAWRP